MKKDNTIIFWVIGILLIIIVAPNLPLIGKGAFAIVTTTTCSPETISNYQFEGNIFDSNNLNTGTNFGGNFVNGKFSQAISFNGTSYISLPTFSGDKSAWIKTGTSDFSLVSTINGTNYVNAVQSNSILIPEVGPTFGLGTNLIVDDLTTYSSLSITQMQQIYSSGTGNPACYTETMNINVSCSDYATSQILDNSTGSLSYSNGSYPDCTFTWKEAQYKITNNLCSKSFFYTDSCIASNGCYIDMTTCSQNLKYECYVFSNNACLPKTDYTSCRTNITYAYPLLSNCQAQIKNVTVSTQGAITTSTTTSQVGFSELASKEIFNLFGYSITIIHIILAFILILGIAYLLTGRK
ncbi:MAG: hypothetical protein WC758_07825 [Candidatus Woesearchaeota archaeon]|jgi:hypothetical protein